ncbi:hypothetical protein ThrDRAFT_01160 [Frankia casuarinae]|jgi:2-phosphoglycerate kinase|uniref:301aa long hypothetical 2-phosphoglycerate kinase n=1 Tax=Frankia casuarinae (strain DSM 45818 / CECT 9043 / HFP020203 / CcI3) TaxID=106370 RepID=Q2JAE2_FRACC|nr:MULTISPECIES: mevalonate-3-phosphate 5-kinase [Frankia]ABD11750.1 301aa long hypothetical 2-phosphoglycerate kinase [Frankia casuarinae]ETA03413.1 hypothetical protein CcI6DRAFT_01129 [Frankia sp. CcI6]EYT93190.1 hypothetical protein ThrDRAFT_01160 [Frankia casuarinae]KDA42691.1 hypothetical protein BMG523Draft_02391 [Frankia sp. BMG5.23]OHV56259.1 2-phosphoglycerate kinase [Frankia sp. CgIS1]
MATPETTIHIVYGIPCVGKSTGAVAFAHHRAIRTVVQTDYLREVQRAYVDLERVPVLAKVTHTAWELYGSPTQHNIVTGFADHAAAIAPAIGQVVRKLVLDGFDAVVEGAHFHSPIIAALRDENRTAHIRATLLIVRTAEELRKRVAQKGRDRADGNPLKEWQDNIPFMLTIQDYLIADARGKDIEVSTADEWRRSWNPTDVPSST